uniref:Ig-like domain-containing protein n=1 Tax=Calidris pygmaea TaxID=425635 RepID=A0A8C3K4H5_9CHAR
LCGVCNPPLPSLCLPSHPLLQLWPQTGFPFRVVGPGRPLLATVGQDVVLPCHLSPGVDARSLEIRWIRHQLSETVHLYRNGEDLYGEQMEEYIGRTELDRDGLSSGSLDLRISGLRPSDDGQYICTVRDAASYREAVVQLKVAGLWPLCCFMRMVQVSLGWCVSLPELCPILMSIHAVPMAKSCCEGSLPIRACPGGSTPVVLEVFLGSEQHRCGGLGSLWCPHDAVLVWRHCLEAP